MKRVIDIATWNRKEHYEFFGSMDDPFFGVTVEVDMSPTYREAKADNASFFLYSFHRILRAVNAVEALRLRVEEGEVACFDVIHGSSTVGREDGTFGFGFFPYVADRTTFVEKGMAEIRRVQGLTGLCRDQASRRVDLIRFSPVPWIAFTEMKHASSIRTGDTVPRISTGRLTEREGKRWMPLSICVHHGLADGRDVGLFLDALEGK